MKKIIIYDCDGCMFDTRELIKGFYMNAIKHYNKKPLTEQQMDFLMKASGREAFDFLFKEEIKKNTITFEDYFKESQRFHSEKMFAQVQPMLNLLTTLKELQKKNILLAIATNRGLSTHRLLKAHNIHELFNTIMTAQDVLKPKPDPECLNRVLWETKTNIQDALFIGDSDFDRDAAKAIKMDFVGFTLKSEGKYKHPTIIDHLKILRHL